MTAALVPFLDTFTARAIRMPLTVSQPKESVASPTWFLYFRGVLARQGYDPTAIDGIIGTAVSGRTYGAIEAAFTTWLAGRPRGGG